MKLSIITALSSLLGVSVGGIISYHLQKDRFKQEVLLKREEYKTENVAEETIRYYLNDKKYIRRSFMHLSKKIAGFEEDELRRLLVRAGAVRFITGKDENEWWCLVSRLPEYYKKFPSKKNKEKDLNDKN